MSPVATMDASSASAIPDLVLKLSESKDAASAKVRADEVALAVKRSSIVHLSTYAVLDTFAAWASDSKDAVKREIAPVGFSRLLVALGPGADAVFLPYLPVLFALLSDKALVVRQGAQAAINAFIKIVPAEATRQVLAALRAALENPKGWRSQVGVLKAIEALVKEGTVDKVAEELGATIPLVEHAMHDTKSEVSSAPRSTLSF